jgi:hypothetical protein
MKLITATAWLGLIAWGSAPAADYSVGIVNLGKGFEGAGTALKVYSITEKGIGLVHGSPYVFPEKVPSTGDSYEPITVAVSPAHDFAYAVYYGFPGLPLVVGFKITAEGLVYQWQEELSTGDVTLQGSTITAVANYLIENTHATEALSVYVLDQAGKTALFDAGSNGDNLVSAHVDPNGQFYYSCRYIAASYTGVNGPANSVSVFSLARPVTYDTPPLVTSTDPVFVQSICH